MRKDIRSSKADVGTRRQPDAVTGAPMWVRDLSMNFVAANALGRALYSPMLGDPATRRPGDPREHRPFHPSQPRGTHLFPDWEQNADDVVATLRSTRPIAVSPI